MRALLRLIVFGFVVVMVREASATATLLGRRTEISFTEKLADYPTATVSAVLDEQTNTLASLELRLAGKPIEIPRKAFADLMMPNLNTLSVSYSPLSAPDPAVWIHIEFGEPVPSNEPGERFRFSSVDVRVPMNGRVAVGRLIFRAETGRSSVEKF